LKLLKFFKYDKEPEPKAAAPEDTQAREALEAHIEKHVGPITHVLHEFVSTTIHLDVYYVKATEERPFHTFITSGMSDIPMNVPKDMKDYRFAELVLFLPPHWKINNEAFKDENNYFPIRNLKTIARLPHEHQSFITLGHTLTNGNPPEPFADNTQLSGTLLLPPLLLGDKFQKCIVNSQKTIHLYNTILLYKEEMDYKLKAGLDDLLDKFDEAKLSEILDVSRRSVLRS
jgi:Suppressor of fused protein (SUFU)